MPGWLEEMLIRLVSSRDAPTAAVARCAVVGRLWLFDAVRDRCIAIRVQPTFDSKVRSSQDLSVKRTFEEIDEGARLGGRRAASRKHRP